MPRKPRKTLKSRHELNPQEIAYLTDDRELGGFTLLCYRHGNKGFDWDVHPHQLWEDYRDEFLPPYIESHPGQRSLPWWQWDAPDGWCADSDFEQQSLELLRAEVRAAWPKEKQTQYLAKHGLLTKNEAKHA